MTSTPPIAPRKPTEFPVLHGRRRIDDYAWLKDENWQQVMRDPAVLRADIREYLEAGERLQGDGARRRPKHSAPRSFDEFRGRIKVGRRECPREGRRVGVLPALPRGRAASGGVPASGRRRHAHRRRRRSERPPRSRRGRCPCRRQRGRRPLRTRCRDRWRGDHRRRRRRPLRTRYPGPPAPTPPANRSCSTATRKRRARATTPHRGPRPLVEPWAVRVDRRRERLGVLHPAGQGTSRPGSRSTT